MTLSIGLAVGALAAKWVLGIGFTCHGARCFIGRPAISGSFEHADFSGGEMVDMALASAPAGRETVVMRGLAL